MAIKPIFGETQVNYCDGSVAGAGGGWGGVSLEGNRGASPFVVPRLRGPESYRPAGPPEGGTTKPWQPVGVHALACQRAEQSKGCTPTSVANKTIDLWEGVLFFLGLSAGRGGLNMRADLGDLDLKHKNAMKTDASKTPPAEAATAKKFTVKVFGVGGAGGNAVDYMARQDFAGVGFTAVNTDAQALAQLTLDSTRRDDAGREIDARAGDGRRPGAGPRGGGGGRGKNPGVVRRARTSCAWWRDWAAARARARGRWWRGWRGRPARWCWGL